MANDIDRQMYDLEEAERSAMYTRPRSSQQVDSAELARYMRAKERRERREERRRRWSLRFTFIIVLAVIVFLYLLSKVHIVWFWGL